MDTLNRFVLSEMLDPQHGAPFAARAIIRTHLGLPPETNAPAAPVSGAPAAPAPETPAPTATNLPAVNPT